MKLRYNVPRVGGEAGKVVYWKPSRREQSVMVIVARQCGMQNEMGTKRSLEALELQFQ